MQIGKKKIELSKEALRELTARSLTKEEAALVAGGTDNSNHCDPSVSICPDTVQECHVD